MAEIADTIETVDMTDISNALEEISDEMNILCKQVLNLEVSECCEFSEYKEYKELKKSLSIKHFDKNVLEKTKIRYNRYISNIDIWEIDNISFYHIKDDIMMFLNIPTLNIESMKYKLKLMRKIDKELVYMIKTYIM
jgi:hypothetical protein